MSDTYSYDDVAESAHGDLASVKARLETSLDNLGGFVSRTQRRH